MSGGPRPTSVLVVALTLMAWGGLLIGLDPGTLSPLLLLAALAAVGLESLSRPLPYFGSFTVAPALYLGWGLATSPGQAAVLVGLAGALKALFVDTEAPGRRLKNLAADTLPVLAGLWLLRLLEPWSLSAYLLAALYPVAVFLFPGILAIELSPRDNRRWARHQARILLPATAVGFAGLSGALLAESGPAWEALLLLPVILTISLSPVTEATDAEQEPEPYEFERLRLEAHKLAEELNTLDTFLFSVAGCDELSTVLERLGATVQRLTGATSVAVFLRKDRTLEPAYYQSPHRERIRDAALLQLRETVVEEAWRKKALARVEQDASPTRIFEGERALAVPLGHVGVLYLGGFPRTPEDDQIDFLERLCRVGAGPIQSALVHRSLASSRHALSQLEQWVELLATLLDSARALGSTLDPRAVLERVEVNLRQTVPHECGWIQYPTARRNWTEVPEQRLRPEAVDELIGSLMDSGRPLLIDDLSRGRVPAPATGQKSLIAVPIQGESSTLGAVILTSSQVAAFTRQHQHSLAVTGGLSAMFLSNAGLYQELAETHRRLAESQAQLLHANKMAAVGQLAAGVAHEINNPLMAIQVNVDMLTQVSEDEDERESLEMIAEGVERCRNIVNQLLTFSRKARDQRAIVRLGELVAQGLRLLPPAEAVLLSVEEALPVFVEGSREELLQVVTNLISNAREAVAETPRDGGQISIRISRSGQKALLEVCDNGAGVPEDLRQRIFEPFFTTRDVGKGTGLGLYLAYTVVEHHSGTIEVQDNPSGGACFQVRLPAIDP